MSFSSMLFVGDTMQLASIKAVSAGYPFYGRLQLRPQGVIKPGEIWFRLPDGLLQAKVGASVEVGSITLRVAGELLQEPDENFSPFLPSTARPMHWQDVARARVILPGSRIQYRYLFQGPQELIAASVAQLKPTLAVEQRLLQPGTGTQLSGGPLQRSESFFRLGVLDWPAAGYVGDADCHESLHPASGR